MEPHSIPDDVWIDIFSSVDSPAELAVLMRTCRRFHELASRPLLRELKWYKPRSTWRNLEGWMGGYHNMMALPKKLTIGVPFDISTLRNWNSHAQTMTREMMLYDMMYSRIPSFTSLHELVLDGTVISPFTYTILAAVQSLRSLSVQNCSFELHDAYLQSNPNPPNPFFFSSLPITHLSLHNNQFPTREYISSHPLHLITAPTLSSLSLVWTDALAAAYALRKWPLHALTQLDVVVPLLTRDLMDSLLDFVQRCSLGPRIQLSIEKHNLTEEQIRAVQFSLKEVWSYRGPLAFSPRKGMATETLSKVVMNEPQQLSLLLAGLEKLPQCVEVLEIQIRKWDIELLFAIRQLFPDISSLVVRYGMGVFPVDFFVTLGSNILYDLPNLHTLKLIADPTCIALSRQFTAGTGMGGFNNFNNFAAAGFAGGGGGVGGPAIGGGHPLSLPNYYNNPNNAAIIHIGNPNSNSDDDDAYYPLSLSSLSSSSSTSSSSSSSSSVPPPILNPKLQQADLKDYLVGWNRYCKKLRCVQLAGGGEGRWWERRFEGDQWVEVGVRVKGAGADGADAKGGAGKVKLRFADGDADAYMDGMMDVDAYLSSEVGS